MNWERLTEKRRNTYTECIGHVGETVIIIEDAEQTREALSSIQRVVLHSDQHWLHNALSERNTLSIFGWGGSGWGSRKRDRIFKHAESIDTKDGKTNQRFGNLLIQTNYKEKKQKIRGQQTEKLEPSWSKGAMKKKPEWRKKDKEETRKPRAGGVSQTEERKRRKEEKKRE